MAKKNKSDSDFPDDMVWVGTFPTKDHVNRYSQQQIKTMVLKAPDKDGNFRIVGKIAASRKSGIPQMFLSKNALKSAK